jgi:Domain of unknown function (DUF6250)
VLYIRIRKLIALSCIMAGCMSNAGEKDKVMFKEDFTKGMSNWWVEGGQSVKVHDGKLYVKANPKTFDKTKNGGVCTVWCKRRISGDIQIDFDVCVTGSEIKANNINIFLFYSDPTGKSLEKSAHTRKSAAYSLYHQLNGYIFTYLNDFQNIGKKNKDGSSKARFRIRRCPGFKLITETFDYHARKNKIYHVTITRKGKELAIAVDGKVRLTAKDDNPLKAGYWGFRTFRTDLWFANVSVKSL